MLGVVTGSGVLGVVTGFRCRYTEIVKFDIQFAGGLAPGRYQRRHRLVEVLEGQGLFCQQKPTRLGHPA